jgi:signal transduction histidine kinase
MKTMPYAKINRLAMSLPLQSTKTPASDWALDPQVNILLVDDNVRNLDVLESILQIPDYRLIRASSGDEALLALMKDDFAAVVLDIQMPDMSGIELAKFIKQRRRSQHVPILFLTAIFHEDKDVLEGYGVGAVDYLTKPLNPQILKSKIAVFVELFRVSRALTRANTALEQQIDHRKDVHDALQQRNADLESRIQECTAELGRANSALAKANASAAATAQANDEFLDTLSQELRAPLTPSMLQASNWEHDLSLPENVRQAFGSVRQALARQTRLVDDLFALTQLRRAQTRPLSGAVEAHKLLQSTWELFREEAAQKQLDVRFKLDAAQSVVQVDGGRLQQAFWNVLGNAIRFSPEQGVVTIKSRTQGQKLSVSVTDHGPGLEPPELERIFLPLGKKPDASTGDSSGFGLATSRRLVELHGGQLTASSPGRGRGATFCIELPLATAS